jgi:hypothetical protein
LSKIFSAAESAVGMSPTSTSAGASPSTASPAPRQRVPSTSATHPRSVSYRKTGLSNPIDWFAESILRFYKKSDGENSVT